MSKPIIQVENLSKQYQIGALEASYGTLRESLTGAMKAPFKRFSRSGSTSDDDTIWALKGINFEVQQGEVVGIIGRNGAGKSTLLKVLSRITEPTSGSIKLYGRTASLLEVGTGFHPELSGRENIYLNGAIMGMARREIEKKFDEIVSFSGVEKFIDTPVKRYSSGMYLRLAFAVAANLESEILIVDEVLAVGDAEFQKKCLGKIGEVSRGEGRTVLIVSHNLAAIQNFCKLSILLNRGELMCFSETSKTLALYASNGVRHSNHFILEDITRKRGLKSITVKELSLDSDHYIPSSPFEVKIRLKKNEAHEKIGNIGLAIFIFDSLANVLYHLSTLFDEDLKLVFSEEIQYCFKLNSLNLNPGIYNIGVWLQGNGIEQDYVDESFVSFEVKQGNIYNSANPGIVSLIQKEFDFTVSK